MPNAAPTTLLALPEVLLREVLSWSPDGASAHALLSASRALHQLRRDPAAAALLLLRCPACRDPKALLDSCDSHFPGGAADVVRQVLHLMHATANSGGPATAPWGLLQALLYWAVETGDAAQLRRLLALPRPPDLHKGRGRPLHSAVAAGPHREVLQIMLDVGADPVLHNADADPFALTSEHDKEGRSSPWAPLRHCFELFGIAAETPGRAAALSVLLAHCDQPRLRGAVNHAMRTAISTSNLGTIMMMTLLPLARTLFTDTDTYMCDAARTGNLAILEHLLDTLPTPPAGGLGAALAQAALHGHQTAVVALLDRGADVHHDGDLPLWYICSDRCLQYSTPSARLDMARLLLGRGATATLGVRSRARREGGAELVALLQGWPLAAATLPPPARGPLAATAPAVRS